MRYPLLLLVVALLLVSQGCGGGEAKLRNDLKAMGLAYVSFHDEKKVEPANWEELIEFAKQSNLFPESIERVRAAGYVVSWDIKLKDVSPSDTVLAKPPGAGPKLYADGGVRD